MPFLHTLSKLWQTLAIRLGMAWLVVCILPAIVVWRGYLRQGIILQTQINSFLIALIGITLAVLILHKINRFPGRQSLFPVLPTFLMITLGIGAVVLVLRLPYSVYYLASVFVLAMGFLLVSQLLQQYGHITAMAYIPLGRCQDFEQGLTNIDWFRLDNTQQALPEAIEAIVVDLSAPEIDSVWQKFLASQTLQGMPVYNHLQVHESLTGRSPIQHLYENDLGSLLPSQLYLTIKQWLDCAVIIVTAPIVVPIVLLTIVAIRLESQGNAIFTQERVGQGGKIFKIYKLRSMAKNAEAGGAKMAQTNDVRVTKVGKFIRKTRIDELPQFINVLKGEMSLIGPRPEQKSFVDEFEQKIPFYSYRHIVKPGISGWAQVTQGYASDEDETKVKLEHDFYYIKNFSFTLDMLIVIKTIQTMLTGFGAK